jgi:hypothetical protein
VPPVATLWMTSWPHKTWRATRSNSTSRRVHSDICNFTSFPDLHWICSGVNDIFTISLYDGGQVHVTVEPWLPSLLLEAYFKYGTDGTRERHHQRIRSSEDRKMFENWLIHRNRWDPNKNYEKNGWISKRANSEE